MSKMKQYLMEKNGDHYCDVCGSEPPLDGHCLCESCYISREMEMEKERGEEDAFLVAVYRLKEMEAQNAR